MHQRSARPRLISLKLRGRDYFIDQNGFLYVYKAKHDKPMPLSPIRLSGGAVYYELHENGKRHRHDVPDLKAVYDELFRDESNG